MQVTKIQVIFLDGYKDWNVTRTKTKQISGEFTQELCHKAICSLEGHDEYECPTLYHVSGEKPVVNGNVITCMGEESGVVFVGY